MQKLVVGFACLSVLLASSGLVVAPSARPAVSGVAPANGSTAGGTVVTVSGSNFTGASKATFAGTAGTALTVVSATQLRVTAPAHAAGVVDVQVTTAGGTSTAAAADRYTYVAPSARPAVSGVAPANGSTAGGTVVTVSGSNFTGASKATFAGTAGTALTVVSATQLRVTAPAHAAGGADVHVTMAGGTSTAAAADRYTYVAPCVPGVVHVSGTASVNTACGPDCVTAYMTDGNRTVASGATLTIAAGTVVKSGAIAVQTGGSLTVSGTAVSPVVFISVLDDSIGGDSNGDGTGSTPAAGDYLFGIAARGDAVSVSGAVFRYANVGIVDDNSNTFDPDPSTDTVTVSQFTNNRSSGIQLLNGWVATLSVQNSTFTANTVGLAAQVAHISVSGSTFANSISSALSAGSVIDLSQISLSGPGTNRFLGSKPARAVAIHGGSIADAATWTVSGHLSRAVLLISRPVSSSHSLAGATGSAQILPGTVIKGSDSLFDLGPGSDFAVNGSLTEPVVFTSADDDSAGGDTNGDGSAASGGRLNDIFAPNQGGAWAIATGAAGVDLDRVGPGAAEIDNTVVQRTDTAFAACLVCTFISTTPTSEMYPLGSPMPSTLYPPPPVRRTTSPVREPNQGLPTDQLGIVQARGTTCSHCGAPKFRTLTLPVTLPRM